MYVPPIVIYLTAWAGLNTAVWVVFERLNTVATDPLKERVSAWLKNEKGTPNSTMAHTFADLFDKVFTTRHFSWRCFFRSCIASLASIAVVTVIRCAIYHDFGDYFGGFGSRTSIFFLIIVLVLNLGPDYCSLLESRWVINRIRNADAIQTIAWLTLDLIATPLIWSSAFVLVNVIALLFYWDSTLSEVGGFVAHIPSHLWLSLKAKLEWPSDMLFPMLGVSLYSTFFTTLWVWLYVSSRALFRLLDCLKINLSAVSRYLDVDTEPIRVIGFLITVLITAMSLIIAIIDWLI